MFRDRHDAGRQLAEACRRYVGTGPVVVGLPRGGVVVAAEVARALDAPLDIVVVRKLGAPLQPELAIGAVYEADGPQVTLDDVLVDHLGVSEEYVEREVREQVEEIRRREAAYRGDAEPVPIGGRLVIVVDDGIATGASTRAGLRSLRARGPGLLVLAVPVASPEALKMLRREADEVICLFAPERFRAVGEFFAEFDQTTDGEVIQLLSEARSRQGAAGQPMGRLP